MRLSDRLLIGFVALTSGVGMVVEILNGRTTLPLVLLAVSAGILMWKYGMQKDPPGQRR
jgi:hypothetical protein